jgi:hypothetical protein
MQAKLDENRNPTLIGVDKNFFTTPTTIAVDPVTHALEVDATVTATIDTSGLATDTNQTDGSQKTQLVDGAGDVAGVTGGKLDVNASIDTTGLATTATDTNTGTIAGDTTSIDGKVPSLGQALAASSVPVVLTADQITTLTPPAAITGFATSAKQLADNHQVTVSNTSLAVTGTVTANLSATDNTVLDNIDTNTDFGGVVGAGAAATALRVHLSDEALAALENITVVSSGTVTANAGTNLNTSLLATEVTLGTVHGHVDSIDSKMVSGTDIGDVTINNSSGASAVPIQDGGNTITVDGAVTTSGTVTEASAADIKTSVQLIDDVIYTSGDALSKTAGVAAQFDDVSPGAVTENKMAPVRMSSRREIYSTIRDAAGNERGLNVDANGAIAITVASIPSHAVTNAGTFAVQVDGAALTALQLIDNAVSGSGYNITQLGGQNVSMNTGTRDAGTQRVTIATNDVVPVTFTGSTDVATQTTLAAINTKLVTGTDIGDVTINNASGANAVNIQDGGNTITVDGTVTANLGSTDNSVIDSIDTSTASKYITGIGHGVKTVTTAGTDLALATSTPCKKVTIQAQTDNTNIIAVGGSGVDATIATGTGVALYPGDVFELDIDNLADVYIDSLVNGEGVRYTYFT